MFFFYIHSIRIHTKTNGPGAWCVCVVRILKPGRSANETNKPNIVQNYKRQIGALEAECDHRDR